MARRRDGERDAELRAEVKRELVASPSLRRQIEDELRPQIEAEVAEAYEDQMEAAREERESWALTLSILAEQHARRAQEQELIVGMLRLAGAVPPEVERALTAETEKRAAAFDLLINPYGDPSAVATSLSYGESRTDSGGTE